MNRILIALITVGLLLIVSCTPTQPTETPTPPMPTPTPSNQQDGVVLPNEPPEDINWISPGKVMVGNFYPGARAEWELLVHNGGDTIASFAVTYRYPDHIDEGYEFPPEGAQDWVIIADPTPVIAPRETKEILIALDMPEGAVNPAPKWEFWISVIDTTQSGMVQVELCSRWLVSMR